MVTKGAKVIVIGAIDGAQLGTQVEAAKDAGAIVIAYDRLIKNTDDVDYYVAYDNFKVGELQGQALLDGMARPRSRAARTTSSCSPARRTTPTPRSSSTAPWSVLQPKIDDGTLVVASGQTDVQPGRHPGLEGRERAEAHGHAADRSTYTSGRRSTACSRPNDTLARAIITSVKDAGKPIPVVTGQDSEVESVKSIMAGEQYSTINKDTRNAGGRDHRDGAGAPEGRGARRSTTPSRTTTASRSSRPYLLPPVDRHQGERQGGLRQRPDAPRDRQRGWLRTGTAGRRPDATRRARSPGGRALSHTRGMRLARAGRW